MMMINYHGDGEERDRGCEMWKERNLRLWLY